MKRDKILPLRRPSAEDRQLCKGVEWPEVSEILSATNLKADKITNAHGVFNNLITGKGIQYIGKNPHPTEPKLEFRVGEIIDMTADFHSMVNDVNKLIFRSNVKKGMDFVRYPHVTRDYSNGWIADDPLKRLAYAQTMIIERRKQVKSNTVVAPDASDDDSDSAPEQEESYDPGKDEDTQSSTETAAMPALPAIENGNSTNGSTDTCFTHASCAGFFSSTTSRNASPVSSDDAVDVVTEPVPRGTPTEPSGTSSKSARDEMATRAEAVGLESAKWKRDDKIKAAEDAIETAEQELSEAVHAKEEELRLQKAAQEQQACKQQYVVEFFKRRRKRAHNRKNHWDAVKRRQTDADGHLACAICNFWDHRDASGTQISDTQFRLDHKIALCLCGKDNDPDNLQILCGSCDNRKTEDDMQKYVKKRMTEARDLVRARATQD